MNKQPKTKFRTYRLYTYDVWGNARDGFQVNDRYWQGEIGVTCKRQVYNAGTDQEFATYEPTDLQLNRAIGGRGLSWDGESDHTLYAENKRNGCPACELEAIN